MADTVLYYKGKPIADLTKDELVDALTWAFQEIAHQRKRADRYLQAAAALAEPEPEGPTDAETEPVIKPIQPPGRIGMTWQQTIQGLRDVLADESKDAVQMVWQRTRICDAVDLMEANSAALAEPEPKGPTDEEILELSQWHEVSYTLSNGDVIYPMQEGTDMRDAVLSFTKAVLTRWGK